MRSHRQGERPLQALSSSPSGGAPLRRARPATATCAAIQVMDVHFGHEPAPNAQNQPGGPRPRCRWPATRFVGCRSRTRATGSPRALDHLPGDVDDSARSVARRTTWANRSPSPEPCHARRARRRAGRMNSVRRRSFRFGTSKMHALRKSPTREGLHPVTTLRIADRSSRRAGQPQTVSTAGQRHTASASAPIRRTHQPGCGDRTHPAPVAWLRPARPSTVTRTDVAAPQSASRAPPARSRDPRGEGPLRARRPSV